MVSSGGAGGQRGAGSDPRHGKARGEMVVGDSSQSLFRQVAFVVLGAIGFLAALALVLFVFFDPWHDPITGSSVFRYVAAAVLAIAILTAMVVSLLRRRRRPSLDEALRSRRPD